MSGKLFNFIGYGVRKDDETIDYDALQVQPGDSPPVGFRFYDPQIPLRQVACHVTYTNPGTVMSWHGIPRIREVSLYAGTKGDVSSVLVCVDLEHQPRPARRSKPVRLFGWKLPTGTAA